MAALRVDIGYVLRAARTWISCLPLVVLASASHLAQAAVESAAESDAASEETPEEILHDACEGWKRLRARFLHSHGKGLRYERHQKSGVLTAQSGIVEFWTSGDWKRIDHLDKETSRRATYSLNSNYGFRAEASKPDSPFVVTDVGPFDQVYWSGASQGLPGRTETMFHTLFREFVQAGWTLYGLPLDEIATSDGFALKSCRSIETGDGRRVEIHCAWTAPQPDLPSCQNITLVLIPAMDYTLERFACDYGPDLVSLNAEYRTIDNVPVPFSVKRRVESPKTPNSFIEAEFELTEFEFGNYPETVFTAEALGLPEPTFISATAVRGSRFGYLLTLNVLIVGFLCWLVWRRHIAPRHQNPTGMTTP